MTNFIGTTKTVCSGLKVLAKAMSKVKKISSQVQIKNNGIRHNLNYIEICNTGENLVRDVSIQIAGLPNDECWWEHPNNSDQQKLWIPFIEPNACVEYELMFTHFNDTDIVCEIDWKDWLGVKHSKTMRLHLEGLC